MPQRSLTIFLGLAITILMGWLLMTLRFVFLPLVLAVFITFLLTPLVNWLTRRKIPLFIASAVTIILAVMVLYLTGTMVLKSLVAFQSEFPKYELQIQGMVGRAEQLADLNIGPLTNERLREELSRLSLSSVVGSILNSFFSFLTYLVFTFVFVIYFLTGSPRLPEKIKRSFSPQRAETINQAVNSIGRQVQRYIWAKTLTSIITGGLMIIICLIFKVDFPITWGFFTFLLNWIPTLGVFIASIPPPILVLISTGSWVTALWVVVILSAVFLTLGNYIEPIILGESVNLSPLMALFALIFWGWLWGPAGMIVAVPVTAMVKFTCDNVEELRPLGVLMGGAK